MKIYRFVLSTILFLIFSTPICIWASDVPGEPIGAVQVSDSLEIKSKEKGKKDKNVRFSVLGGPGYTPDYGFVVGGSALVTFHLPRMESFEARSVLPVAFSLSFGDKVGFSALVRPQLFFAQDRMRLMGDFIYSNLTSNYYGVGFDYNKSVTRGKETTQYYATQTKINPIYLFRMGDSDFFLGPTVHFQIDKMTNISEGVANDPDYIAAGGSANGYTTYNGGLGVSLNYDSRDIPANAYSGIYFDFKGLVYGGYLGGDFNYQQLQVRYKQYTQLSRRSTGKTLAWTVYSENIFGDAPFTRLTTIGSPFDLRGYYQGQYRDNSAHVAMVEFRHEFAVEPVNFWSKVANRLGYAAWAGAGVIGPTPFDIDGVLPNFGAGIRIEVQPRMNFRIDMGYSPIERQKLVYFNMTEAF